MVVEPIYSVLASPAQLREGGPELLERGGLKLTEGDPLAEWVGPLREIFDDSPRFHFDRKERRHKAPTALVAGGDGRFAAGLGPVSQPRGWRAEGRLRSGLVHE